MAQVFRLVAPALIAAAVASCSGTETASRGTGDGARDGSAGGSGGMSSDAAWGERDGMAPSADASVRPDAGHPRAREGGAPNTPNDAAHADAAVPQRDASGPSMPDAASDASLRDAGLATSHDAGVRDASVFDARSDTSLRDAGLATSHDAGVRDASVFDARVVGEGGVEAGPDGSVLVGGPSGPFFIAAEFEGEQTVGTRTFASLAPAGSTNVYLSRTDGTGAVQWVVPIQCQRSLLAHVSASLAGNAVYLTIGAIGQGTKAPVSFGTTSGFPQSVPTLDSSVRLSESFVARYDLDGKLSWVRRFGLTNAPTYFEARGVAHVERGPGGALLVAGSSRGELSVSGNPPPWPQVETVLADDGSGGGVRHVSVMGDSFEWALLLDDSTGQVVPGSLMIGSVTRTETSGVIWNFLVSRNGHAWSGAHYALGGATNNGNIVFGANTTSPVAIGDATDLNGSGWIARVSTANGTVVDWAYRISASAGQSHAGGGLTSDVSALAGGDVVAIGNADSGALDLHHAGGATSLAISPVPATDWDFNGWVARYRADGTEVVWAKAMWNADPTAWVLPTSLAIDEPHGALYVGGNGGGKVTLGPGEARETTLDVGPDGLFLARFDLATGSLRWAVGQPGTHQPSFTLLAVQYGSPLAHLYFSESLTFDQTGQNLVVTTPTGVLANGIVQYGANRTFGGFTEFGRPPTIDAYAAALLQ